MSPSAAGQTRAPVSLTCGKPRLRATEKCTAARQDAAARAIRSALARHVGRGCAWSVADLASATGISERQLRGYVAGEAAVPAPRLLALADVLGPAFLQEAMAGSRFRVTEAAPQPVAAGAACSAAAGFTAALAEAWEDGRIDHRERRALILGARRLGETLGGLLAGLEVAR